MQREERGEALLARVGEEGAVLRVEVRSERSAQSETLFVRAEIVRG